MGVYLSSPVTEKESINEECPNQGYSYGASSMQGWRITQEDAHNCIPVFDEKSKTSFFAVYDGHGGSEVAKYCEMHFPDFVKGLMDSTGGFDTNPTQFIQAAFLAFDATLTNEDVIKELKVLSGKEDDADEDEEDDPVYRSETDLLNEEATMPLDQVLAQYNSGAAGDSKTGQDAEAGKADSSAGPSGSGQQNGSASSSDKPCSSSSSSPSSSLPPAASSACVNNKDSAHKSPKQERGTTAAPAESSTNNNCSESGVTTSPDNLNDSSREAAAKSSSNSKETEENKNSSAIPAESSSVVSSSSSPSPADKAGGSSKDGPSSSLSKSTPGVRSSKAKAAADMAKAGAVDDSDDDDDDDDDDEEEEEDMWEDMSDDDDDDDDENEADAEQDENVPMMDTSDEEPGSDSGCTACVLLKQDKKLVVANAGDSRCVLSRAGRAVELSFDHKPEDDPEMTRIEKAGGKVTADGRVNGGLNLSRAIGDHVYKRNTEVSAREQMITALPDVHIEHLCDEDQFIVIACDGIWNYMSSQEVVDYVLGKLKDPEKRKQPSIICEEMFDHCLAPNTFGDGTGCDNMTCVIIVLDTFKDCSSDDDPQAAAVGVNHSSDVDEAKPEADSGAARNSTGGGSGLAALGIGTGGEGSGHGPCNSNSDENVGKECTTPMSLKRCADDVDTSGKKRLKVEDNVVG